MSDFVKSALRSYFDYKKSIAEMVVFSHSEYILSNDDSSSGFSGSRVPSGVKMTDVDFLRFINRIEARLNQLNIDDSRCFQYVTLRYKYDLKASEISKAFKCSERECRRLNVKAIKFMKTTENIEKNITPCSAARELKPLE